MPVNDPIKIAAAFVNRTNRNIFLTGKAGTGKTTFLRELAEHTHKNYMIVAPTGIAALNAGGATIHSQFSLPFGAFVPDPNYRLSKEQSRGFFTREILFRNFGLSKTKKNVLRSLELLIIDEVSMLRADILDAIDVRLKSAKNIWDKPFAGVQILFIGDLFQLPPIVKDDQRPVLRNYYPNQNFYHALALKQSGLIYVELEKVFRQSDDVFLDVLNNLRQNQITANDRNILNDHYIENYTPPEGVITLATHNKQVDRINRTSLDELKGESHFYRAKIEGDFPENMYPCERELELKVGAQVMFVRNDSSQEKRFFNGKLAKVVDLDPDAITVILDGEEDEFMVPKETWENAKYAVDSDDISPELEVVGTFMQFPLKLAWAVTIHKSQGLTFDRAVVDVGRAFAPGQVYVALSRLRTLDGLVLRTPVPLSAVQSDPDIVHFSNEKRENTNHVADLKEGQRLYVQILLEEAFDFKHIRKLLDKTIVKWHTPLPFHLDRIANWPKQWLPEVEELFSIGDTFRGQLHRLISEGEEKILFERLEKGVDYFEENLKDRLQKLYAFTADVSQIKGTKQMVNEVEEVEQELVQKWKRIHEVMGRSKALLSGKVIQKDEAGEKSIVRWRKDTRSAELERARSDKELAKKKGRKKGRSAKSGLSTYQQTYNLYKQGVEVKDIAAQRELTVATVLGHLARGISQGEVSIDGLMEANKLQEIKATYEGQESLTAWRDDLNKKYSFHDLRLVKAVIDKEKLDALDDLM